MSSSDPDALIRELMSTFWGYGNLAAPLWFVGMEEGGGATWEHICRHIDAWHAKGRPAVTDLRPADVPDDHPDFGIRPKLKPYWSRLSRIAFAASHRRAPSLEEVRRYQADSLGAADGETCLLELLPLPSPSTSEWLYGAHSRLPELRDRKSYRDAVLPPRRRALRGLIATHRPRAVVFLGVGYAKEWNAVMGQDDLPTWPQLPTTRVPRVVIARHPSTHGTTSDSLHDLGLALAINR